MLLYITNILLHYYITAILLLLYVGTFEPRVPLGHHPSQCQCSAA